MPLSHEYQSIFKQLASVKPAPRLWEMTPEQGRGMYRLVRPVIEGLPVGEVNNQIIQSSEAEIPIRIYYPEGQGPFGSLLYFHGGGWVIGDLDTGDAVCREISTLANVVVVSVDYRMAPEAVYPAAVKDAYAALEWVGNNELLLKANSRIGVVGESAGGNLSAVVALKARELKGPNIDFQCLVYPVTDYDLTRQSWSDHGTGYMLEARSMKWFWDIYCPDEEKRIEPYASPLREKNLENLPKALVVTAEYDPLRDEGEAYAMALQKSGVNVTYKCYGGMIHDFFSTASTFPSSRTGFLETIEAIKKELS